MPEVKTHIFPNGFRLVYEKPINNMKISHINAFCHVGSANEDDLTRGAAHFVEHMCFKGTPKFHTSKDIETHYDTIGAYFNAHTTKQYTCYQVKCADQYAEKSISILGNIMLNSVFDKKEYKKEMNVVIEENLRNHSTSSANVYEMFYTLIFKGSVYENPVDCMKYHKKKDALKYEDVIDFYRRHYVPENMVLSITTCLSFAKILHIIEHTDYVKPKKHTMPILNIIPRMSIRQQTAPICDLHTFTVEQMAHIHLIIGFRVCSMYDPDWIGLRFLDYLIGGMFTSRLFTLLREKNGLTYKSSTNTMFYENAGCFSIYASTSAEKLMHNESPSKKGVFPLIIDLLNDLVKNGVTQQEINKTKQHLNGKSENSHENANIQSNYNGLRVMLHNDEKNIISNEDFYSENYEKITRTHINELIRKYFRRDNMNVALIGGGLPNSSVIKKHIDHFKPSYKK